MANPILNENFGTAGERVLESEPMTLSGTINKIAILFLLVIVGAYCAWNSFSLGYTDRVSILTTVGFIVSLLLGFIIPFVPTWAPVLSPVYALAEGLLLGGISAMFEKAYPGIVIQATIGTFAALGTMLALYKFKIIRCTERFKSTVFTAMMAVFLIYLIDIIASFFGRGIPLINGNGIIGIVFSLVVIAIASFCLIVDFSYIEEGSNKMLPKYYEWYGAYGLMVTLIWLYFEMLKLFAKLNSRNG
ncbi:MAG: Bax inhibitor-1/YccA family protein [Clostridiaceae bacterium]|jgi:uncharacterized YccA/Bax inhibitor family protein|nr:Bax inhibitor-1/YccA family protein [Clostridiaceae bacterium]